MSVGPVCRRVRGGTFTNYVHLTVVSNSHAVLGPKRKGGWNVSILPRKTRDPWLYLTPEERLHPPPAAVPSWPCGPPSLAFSVHSSSMSFMAQCPHPTLRAFPFPLIAPLF